MPKKSIRNSLLQQRRSLHCDEMLKLCSEAQKRLLSHEKYVSASRIALYAPIHNEVDTSLVFSEALASGKTVLFPAVVSDGIEFRTVYSSEQFVQGKFGIPEPLVGCLVYAPEDIDLFIVPGVAFDLGCRRVGYGRGYYDRALHRLEGSGRLAGFCYDFQILDQIPVSSHDVQMDLVITDRRAISTPGQFT